MCILHQILLGDEIRDDEFSRIRVTSRKFMQNFSRRAGYVGEER